MARTGEKSHRASLPLPPLPPLLNPLPCLGLIVYRRQRDMDILWRTVIKTRSDSHGLRRSELKMVREKAGDWRARVEQSGGTMWPDWISFSGCYCRGTYHLACLRQSSQGRVNSCKICIAKQVIGHVLKPWENNSEHPLPSFDLVALCVSRESAWAVSAAQVGRHSGEIVAL